MLRWLPEPPDRSRLLEAIVLGQDFPVVVDEGGVAAVHVEAGGRGVGRRVVADGAAQAVYADPQGGKGAGVAQRLKPAWVRLPLLPTFPC